MSTAGFIAGDWGTTNLRLYLCDSNGNVLSNVDGPGASQVSGDYATLFASLTSPWNVAAKRKLPAVLCGMVGSSIGWRMVNALQCPVSPDAVAQSISSLPEQNVFIVPGLSCRNALDAPDVMRGEETQILGALQLNPSLRKGRHVLCLPGTHTKWVTVADNSIEGFITVPTGEVFSLLYQHSVLVRDARSDETPVAHDPVAFDQGLREARNNPDVGLLARLFQCRSRRLAGELASQASSSFLSGLLIASEVMDAMALMSDEMSNGVTLIGNARLGNLYQQALNMMNNTSTMVPGDDAVLQGLTYVHTLLHQRGEL